MYKKSFKIIITALSLIFLIGFSSFAEFSSTDSSRLNDIKGYQSDIYTRLGTVNSNVGNIYNQLVSIYGTLVRGTSNNLWALIDSIDDSTTATKAFVSSISTKIDSVIEAIETLSTTGSVPTAMVQNVANIYSLFQQSDGRINSLDSKATTTNSRLSTINTSIGTTNTNLSTINTSIGSTNTKLDTVISSLSTINATLTNGFTNVVNSISNLTDLIYILIDFLTSPTVAISEGSSYPQLTSTHGNYSLSYPYFQRQYITYISASDSFTTTSVYIRGSLLGLLRYDLYSSVSNMLAIGSIIRSKFNTLISSLNEFKEYFLEASDCFYIIKDNLISYRASQSTSSVTITGLRSITYTMPSNSYISFGYSNGQITRTSTTYYCNFRTMFALWFSNYASFFSALRSYINDSSPADKISDPINNFTDSVNEVNETEDTLFSSLDSSIQNIDTFFVLPTLSNLSTVKNWLQAIWVALGQWQAPTILSMACCLIMMVTGIYKVKV